MSEAVEPQRRLKMKELEATTGVGREAIRYYINEGLLPEPDRPKRNVAFYSDEHVARIRAIKHLQEKRYLPLSVIRNLLDHDASALLTAGTTMPGIELLLPALVDGVSPEAPRSIDDVAVDAGLSVAELREMAALDVIAVSEQNTVDFRDAAIAEVWGGLRAAGFTPELGYGTAELALYTETLRWLAKEEVGRFLGRLSSGGIPIREGAELGAEGVRLGNELIALLRTRAIVEALNEDPA